MRTINSFSLIIILATCLSCSKKIDVQSLYCEPLHKVTSDVTESALKIPDAVPVNFDTREYLIYDTLVFSFLIHQDHIVSISNTSTGELLGNFCKRGRAWDEPIDVMPLQEIYVDDGELKADLLSYNDSKLFTWNISKSLKTGRDVYDHIIRLELGKGKVCSIPSYRRINKNHVLCFNSKETRGYDKNDVPEFCIYNTDSGQYAKGYELFSVPDIELNPDQSYRDFYSNRFTVKPDGSKVFVAMCLMPAYSLINLKQDTTESFLLTDLKPCRSDVARWYFADIQSDNDLIYALYSGEPLYNPKGDDIPKTMYVFDWNGNLRMKLSLPDRFTEINIDNGTMYLSDYKGLISEFSIQDIKNSIL